MQEPIKNNELDKLIRDVLASDNDLIIPPGLPDKTIRKLEKKVLLRELILELFFKVGLALGSLVILAGILIWINGRGLLTGLYTHLMANWQIITSLLLLVLITILIDQVGLKFFTAINKGANLKA